MESQPQNSEFRINPENGHLCSCSIMCCESRANKWASIRDVGGNNICTNASNKRPS